MEKERYHNNDVWVVRDEYNHGTIQIHDKYRDFWESNRYTIIHNPKNY